MGFIKYVEVKCMTIIVQTLETHGSISLQSCYTMRGNLISLENRLWCLKDICCKHVNSETITI